jgi:predicted TIM-barrel fold metal-dependent hydrolase
MIVDVHYHLIPVFPEAAAEMWVGPLFQAATALGKQISRKDLVKQMVETIPDPTGERLLASMEESGVDFTCICAMDDAGNEMFTPEIAQTQNKLVGQLAQNNSDRLLALAGVDPRRPNAPDMLKQCFEEFGVKGLKYHPDSGYDPSGPDSYKLLEILQDHGGILLTHTGPLMPPMRAKYAEAALLADIGVDFPNLKVIAAHMGQINWRPWASLATHQPNLYGDLAAWDALAFGNYKLFCRELRDLIDFAGVSKVLFGSDSPIVSIVEPTKNWIQLIRTLPVDAPEGIEFSQDEVDAILGGNAAALLGL